MKIHGNAPDGLHSISMDRDALYHGQPRKLLHGLNGPGLVVGKHQRCQSRLLGECGCHKLRAGNTFSIDRWAVHAEFLGLERGYGRRHRRMLDRTGNKMSWRLVNPGQAEDGQVIGFGSPRGENDLARLSSQNSGHGLLGLFPGPACLPTRRMPAFGITGSEEIRTHDFENFGIKRRRRVVVEVNRVQDDPFEQRAKSNLRLENPLQPRHRRVKSNPMTNKGIPRIYNGPAQRAIPTTMMEKPSRIPARRPIIPKIPIKSLKGRVIKYQIAVTRPVADCPTKSTTRAA